MSSWWRHASSTKHENGSSSHHHPSAHSSHSSSSSSSLRGNRLWLGVTLAVTGVLAVIQFQRGFQPTVISLSQTTNVISPGLELTSTEAATTTTKVARTTSKRTTTEATIEEQQHAEPKLETNHGKDASGEANQKEQETNRLAESAEITAKGDSVASSSTTTTSTTCPFGECNSSSGSSSDTTTNNNNNPKNKPLNVLILYPDDWRHDSLGCAGTQPVFTPFLDSLAQQGIRFKYNSVTTSICWISRATLVTGQYLSRHKSEDLLNPIFYEHWNETWPYLLQKNGGYYVGHVGKWQYVNYTWVEEHYNWTRLHEGYHWFDTWSPNGTVMVHAADLASEQGIQFLQERPKDRPFALTIAYYPPKAIGSGSVQWWPKNSTLKLYENMTIPEPLNWNASWYKLPAFFHQGNEARVRWEQRFGNASLFQNSLKSYYAMITEVDAAAKRVVDELERQGILNETMVIFTCDNGFFLGEHGLAGKWYPYQESIRVPLIIHDPRIPAHKRGTVDESFTLNIDLASTILKAANLEPSPRMQGRNIADLYMDADKSKKHEPWRDEFFYEHHSMGSTYIPASSALVRKDYKYMLYPEWNVEQLFDLVNDPMETEDLSNWTDQVERMKEMRARHDQLKEQAL